MQEYIEKYPGSAVDVFVKKAVEINVSFIKYYKTLERENVSPRNCLLNYENICKEK